MPASAPTYDLVMLLDLEAEDEARAKPLADARAAIEAQGELLRHDEWGNRALAYAIDRRDAADIPDCKSVSGVDRQAEIGAAPRRIPERFQRGVATALMGVGPGMKLNRWNAQFL